MSIVRELPLSEIIPGLRVTRRLGEKLIIEHKGEILVIQYSAIKTAGQIQLSLNDPSREFKIVRAELRDEK